MPVEGLPVYKSLLSHHIDTNPLIGSLQDNAAKRLLDGADRLYDTKVG